METRLAPEVKPLELAYEARHEGRPRILSPTVYGLL
jgi:hypothetical protein